LYTSCVLGLRPFTLFNEFFTYKKKNKCGPHQINFQFLPF
jgi:hypothetical protein